MPLPPALLQRLAKRGIVDKSKTANSKKSRRVSQQQQQQQNHQNEEIIAEDYDEIEEPYPYDYEPVKKPQENFWSERLKRRIVDGSVTGYKGCPNKYNIYHKCTLYCMNAYGDGILEPKRSYTKRQKRLVKRYPLPKDWKEIYDFGCGVHYYWNTVEDLVSWLPPSHPKAILSKSAAQLRKELEALLPDIEETTDEQNMTIYIEGMNIELPIPSSQVAVAPTINTEKDSGDEISTPLPPPPPTMTMAPTKLLPPSILKKPKPRDLEKTIRSRSERRQRADAHRDNVGALDPMDPAAYSDIPRGKWSAGLDNESNKTGGVDSTVTGTPFQMRPYPSPGSILKTNLKGKQPKDSIVVGINTGGDENEDDEDGETESEDDDI